MADPTSDDRAATTLTTGGQRRLGPPGAEIPRLGLGCWAIGGPWEWNGGPGGWGEVDDDESIRAIHRGLAGGVRFFDTAANYGAGHSERVLGRALAGRRDEVIVATKFGFVVDEAGQRVTRYPGHAELVAGIRAACEASLRRLGTDVIDLYQFHVWDHPPEQAPDVIAELESLVADGKIRWYGWSTDSVERARAFAQGEHCATVQHDLNVVHDAPGLLALCTGLGLTSIARSPLARGALTGKYGVSASFGADDIRRGAASMEAHFAPTLEKLEAIREILTSEGRTLAQGSLAWIWARSPVTIPIPGFRTEAQVAENVEALAFGPLRPGQMAELERHVGEGAGR